MLRAAEAAQEGIPDMRAAIFTSKNQPLSLEDVAPLPPGPKDVLVRISATGVCHSDLWVVEGCLPLPPPVILGHEGTGVIVEVELR